MVGATGLDRYRLLVQIGAGPDGVAYRALAADGTTVEVRDLSGAKADAGRWQRLASRLRLATLLVHPAAIRVREMDLDQAPPTVALEWVEGARLGDALRGALPLPEAEALGLARPLAEALAEAHRLGLAHGRIDPDRMVLDKERRPRIDLTTIEVETYPGSETGSPPHESRHATPPEGRTIPVADREEDVRGLGALLGWLLTGRRLPSGDDRRGMGIDPATPIGRLLGDMLAPEPADRPSTREVAHRLGVLADRLAVGRSSRDTDITTKMAAKSAFGATIAAPEVPPGPDRPSGGLRLGRFRLLEEIGRGSQGVVYRAEDTADGSIVAIKVLRPGGTSRPEVLRRFRKEARLLAEANNPHVVNLLEYNEDGDVAYLALEFVAGRDLGELLAPGTRLDEPTALAIAAGVARALAEAHARRIVHRDVKPGNILLLGQPSGSDTPPTSGVPPPPSGPRVKLSDFGLARHVVEPESLALTEPGAVVGTPSYMAPEQCTARPVDPRTDVYALGAVLFHMLAGRPPFAAETREELYDLHCHEPAPPLERYAPSASPGAGQVVAKALAKAPEERYPDAGALLRDLERLLRGEPAGIAMHPLLPACDPATMLQFEFRWELRASPRQLWPYVTDTDRLDRAIGFAPVSASTVFETGRGVRTFTAGRKAGMAEVGEEHPYEWVEPRRMGVSREYSRGPFRWVVSTVELQRRPEGGTTLVHRLRLEPRYWWIRKGSPWGIGRKLREEFDKVYRRIDAALAGRLGGSGLVDPFEESAAPGAAQRRRLGQRLDRLAARGVDPAVIERLGDLLGHAPAPALARLRPLALARRWGLDPEAVVAACLHAAGEGLLVLLWDILCPGCRLSCAIEDTLRAVRDHAHCPACDLDFALDFAGSIELVFRAHPEIRAADTATYCVGGPGHAPHVLAQVRVAPGERLELDLSLPEGTYRLRGPQLPWSVDFCVRATTATCRWDIDLSRGLDPDRPRSLGAEGQVLTLSNDCGRELLVRVERTAPRDDVLTAARAASLPLFRELFPGEVLSPGQLVSVAAVTLLVTALERADRLYEELGDARAFVAIDEHFRLLEGCIHREGGTLIKTVGEGAVAAFEDPAAAVRAGLDLPTVLMGREATRGLRLRVAIHRGRALAATRDDHLDYFGATACQAAELLRRADGGELLLTRAVATDPGVAALLRERGLQGEVIPADPPGRSHVLRLVPRPGRRPADGPRAGA